MDDRRVGLIIRALRRRRGWRQADLAEAAHLAQQTVSAAERGHLDTLPLRTIRALIKPLDARGDFDLRWRGGSLDRTLDERHARLVGAVVDVLLSLGWEVGVEVTYAIYGERGSIDVLAFHPASRSLLVVEVKSELTSIEETLRREDEKVRLAAKIALARFGWRTGTTSRLLVLPEDSATRRRVRRHAAVLNSVMPARNIAVRRWLQAPVNAISGLWFLANTSPGGSRLDPPATDRVRRPD